MLVRSLVKTVKYPFDLFVRNSVSTVLYPNANLFPKGS